MVDLTRWSELPVQPPMSNQRALTCEKPVGTEGMYSNVMVRTACWTYSSMFISSTSMPRLSLGLILQNKAKP